MCDADACQLNVRGDGIKPYNLKLDKGHIIGAKPVRLKAGEIVDIGNMRRKQVRKLGYSYQRCPHRQNCTDSNREGLLFPTNSSNQRS